MIRAPALRGKADDAVVAAIQDLYDKISQQQKAILVTQAAVVSLPTADQINSQLKSAKTEQSLSTIAAAQLTSQGVSTGITGQGSILPVPSTGLLYDNATANTIKWYSTGLMIYLPDGRVIVVPDTTVAAPIISVGGLTPSTTYYFYPCYNLDLGMVQFIVVTGGTGTPAAAYTAKSVLAAQGASGDGKIALAPTTSVTAAATSGGGGGGGGGGSGCIRSTMLVQGKRGIIALGHARLGELIKGPEGWTTLTTKKPSAQPEFLRFKFGLGDWIDVTPSHPMATYKSDVLVPAKSLCFADQIPTRSGLPARIIGIELLEESGQAESIECSPFHTFYVGGGMPNLVGHNFNPLK